MNLSQAEGAIGARVIHVPSALNGRRLLVVGKISHVNGMYAFVRFDGMKHAIACSPFDLVFYYCPSPDAVAARRMTMAAVE
jgi:hypothetical protein